MGQERDGERAGFRPGQPVVQDLGWAAGLCLALVTLPAEVPAASPRTNAPMAAIMRAARVIPTGTNTFAVGKVTVDRASRTLRIPAVVNLREQVIEYALVTQSGKTHESLFATEASPTDVHVAALLVGLAPGALLEQTNTVWVIPELSAVTMAASWQIGGRTQRHAFSELMGLAEAEPGVITRVLDPGPWFYNGSRILEGGEFVAQQGGSIVSLIFDPDALVNNPQPDRDNDDIHFPNTPLLPPVGTAVIVEFAPVKESKEAPSANESKAPRYEQEHQ